jgi:hypothetical protein
MTGVLPLLILMLLVIFAAPSALVATILLLPSLLVRAVDSTPGHPLTQAVLLFGCAGAFPCLNQVWHLGNRLPEAVALGTDIRTVAVCWALQAAGWLLGQLIPFAVAFLTRREITQHRTGLEQRKAALQTEWDWP